MCDQSIGGDWPADGEFASDWNSEHANTNRRALQQLFLATPKRDTE